MQRPSPILLRPLAALLVAFSLTSLITAQTYTAAGQSIAGNEDKHESSFPAVAFWDGTGPSWTRHAWSRADQGALEATALSNTYATYNMAAYGIAEFQYDDVVFTSAGSGSIPVNLHLTIEGNSSVVNGNLFRVVLKHGAHVMGDAELDASGGVRARYDLSGWDMTSAFSFDHAMTVPVNTPVSLMIAMVISASGSCAGHQTNGNYTLRLGGATPLPAPGERYEVFDLPAGVTVDSVSGGITDNVWSVPDRLRLSADRTSVASGENLLLTAWNAEPGQLVGLSMGWGPAPPPPAIGPRTVPDFIGVLDSDGWWWADPIPHSPELAGRTMFFRAVSIDSAGAWMRSDEVAVQFL